MEEVYIITPSVCNTQCDTYAENEEIMIDWEGNMIEKPNREQIFMWEITEENTMMASVQISSAKLDDIYQVLQRIDHVLEDNDRPCYMHITWAADEV